MSANKLYRALLSELRQHSQNGVLNKESPQFQYIASNFQKYQTTDQVLCKAKEEMKFLGETYLCYLQSLRRQNAIQKEYSGKGERSIEETASLVGFKLPHDPK